jgi:hypothetical protein
MHKRPHIALIFEPRDLWVGGYIGNTAVYICPIPTLVIRIKRKGSAK